MKKIFFLLGVMNVGGVEKAFLNLLSTLDRQEYEVHVGLYRTDGDYVKMLPADVTVHHIQCYNDKMGIINDPPRTVLRDLVRRGKYWSALQYLSIAFVNRYRDARVALFKYMLRDTPMMDCEFDVAVTYAGLFEMNDFYVTQRVRAPKKYTWIHFDAAHFGMNRKVLEYTFKEYDRIFVVSESAKQSFDRKYPQFAHKTEVRYNTVDRGLIKQQAQDGETFDDGYDGPRILTVGRMMPEKGYDIAVRTARLLSDQGRRFRWYFVGDGAVREECERLAQELGVESCVKFLGKRANPYPFMRDCDLYVQPSRHEGYCLTLAEAKCFDRPIVSTDFSGATEQLKTYPRHRICAADPHSMYDAIIDIGVL